MILLKHYTIFDKRKLLRLEAFLIAFIIRFINEKRLAFGKTVSHSFKLNEDNDLYDLNLKSYIHARAS